jgi:hypothetical protein
MIRVPMPAPGPDLALQVTTTRNELDKVLDVSRGHIPVAVIDGLHRDYSDACLSAGVHPPGPWTDWPYRPANAQPPTRRRVAPATPQRSTTES